MMRNFRATDNYVYSLEERLGQGATGDVYKGTHKKTGQIVALKIFDPKCGFQVGREIGALRKLKHPNIVTFYSVETDTDTKKTVLVMELCERGSLLDFLKEPENLHGLEEEQYLRVFRDLVAGVKHQRDNGFSHRDIKPGNILVFVDEAGNFVYKLSDFGTAKQLSDDGMFQSLVGTEEYLHPDIFRAAFIDNRKGREFSIAADLWSLGATLFHTATGRVPFQPFQGRYDRKTIIPGIADVPVFDDLISVHDDYRTAVRISHVGWKNPAQILNDTQTKIQEIRSEIQQHLQTYKESESDVMPTLQTTSSPLSSTKHRQLAQNVSASVGGIQREISESRSLAMETRDQIQSLSSLLQDMPVPVTCDTT
ncbi:hypothetical protein KUTeg_020992 [Tegillarca granosa]|uniref:IkappaB kinase n=1 Tax=Tegillarca granosa TaxID=220873 RepID=A0ABQ9EET0_TEGGR|nr:hypothetical protein KUTeg_020992 [Tegillarca granosa]